jgi:hypothetical protein
MKAGRYNQSIEFYQKAIRRIQNYETVKQRSHNSEQNKLFLLDSQSNLFDLYKELQSPKSSEPSEMQQTVKVLQI